MRTRNTILILIAVLGLATLVSAGLAGCKDGELADNSDNRPKIISIQFVEGGSERETSAAGQQVNMVDSVVGPRDSCRTGDLDTIMNDIKVAIYLQVPNTQAELDIDAFLSLVAPKGLFERNPATITTVSRPVVQFNTPGSAEGVIRCEVQLSFSAAENFIPTTAAEGFSTESTFDVLTDSAGLFADLGIRPGALVLNRTDLSQARVIEVNSNASLEHTPLQGGINNRWSVGDEYVVTNSTLCDDSNLVFYDYALQVVVVDPDFRGDSLSVPIIVVDNTSQLCKASSNLCP